jgi:glycine oxidase
MMKSPDIVIVGGGIIGSACAYELARAGTRVALVERGELAAEASGASAGLVGPRYRPMSVPMAALRDASYKRFGPLVVQVEEETGQRCGLIRTASLMVALDDASATALHERFVWQQSQGISSTWLSGDEARALEPMLAPSVSAAIRMDGEYAVIAPLLTQRLAEAAVLHGARLYRGTTVIGLPHHGTHVTGVALTDGLLPAGTVVLAAGAWTRFCGDWLGVPVPVFPVRGQIVAVERPPSLLRHVLLAGTGYVAARADGRIITGATEEPEAGFDKRVTVGGMQTMLDQLFTLLPGMRAATFSAAWAGLRPGSPDGLPLIGPLPGYENVFVASGHFRGGILFAPITAEIITALVTGTAPPLDAGPFSPARPRLLAPQRSLAGTTG